MRLLRRTIPIFITALIWPAATGAAGLITVEFERTPLFSEANFLPGDAVTRYVKVKNIDINPQPIGTMATAVSDPDGLGDRFSLTVKEGAAAYYAGTLGDFFTAGEIALRTLMPDEEARFDYAVVFDPAAGDFYQAKEIGFDFLIGAIGAEAGSAYGGGLFIAASQGGGGGAGLPPPAGDNPVVLGAAGAPALAVEKTADREFINPGDRIGYSVRIKNTGSLSAYGVVLTDRLPAGLAYEDGAPAGQWIVGDLAPGESRETAYTVRADGGLAPGEYVNTAVVSASNHDPAEARAAVTVRGINVLGLSVRTGFSMGELFMILAAIAAFLAAAAWMQKKRK